MNFNDIFKSDFLEKVTAVSPFDMIIGMVLSFILGLFIFYVYKRTFKGVLFSASFGVSLIGICMISDLLIMAVSSNVVLSLGMVGALSIVRFRAAIKEPLDIIYLFWAITAGIVLAAGMLPLAVFGSVFIGIVLLIFVNKKSTDDPYILVIRCTKKGLEDEIMKIVYQNTKRSIIKNKTVTKTIAEYSIEVQLNENLSQAFIDTLSEIEGIDSVVLVSYNGDYMS